MMASTSAYSSLAVIDDRLGRNASFAFNNSAGPRPNGRSRC